jgi:iron(III) transport system ATP-binding protein
MSVVDNVAFGLVERRVARDEIRRRVGEALALVGLAEYGARRPNQLSGGQQQRVALARTIVIEPQVLLLDEPLSNLDKKLREQMRVELKRLQRKLGITTIFVTHDQEEAMTTADRMAVLEAGVLQQVGSPRELFDSPANRFVAEFVGSTNVLPGRGDAARGVFVADGLGELPLAAAGDGRAVSVRPHALAISTARDTRRIWFDGEVAESEFLGEFTRYEVRVGDRLLTADSPHLSSSPVFARGAAVQVGIDPAELRLLP